MKWNLNLNTSNPSPLRKWYREKVLARLRKSEKGSLIAGAIDLALYSNNIFIKVCGRELVALRDYCVRESRKMYTVEEEQSREVFVYNGKRDGGECFEFQSPDIYYTLLENVSVRGRSNCIFVDGYCIYPIERMEKDSKVDFKIHGTIGIIGEKIYFGYVKGKRVIEKAIMMLDQASYNYYHLTIEILARLAYIDSMPEFEDYPLLIDRCVWETAQFRELINKVNMYNHEIILIDDLEMCEIHSLVVVSPCAWMPSNVKIGYEYEAKDYMVSGQAMRRVRSRLVEKETVGERKIFISRMNTNNARLTNEVQIREIFRKFGFEIVYPEKMTLEEQIELFKNCSHVAGATGAAFTNILYCQEGTHIICIIPNSTNFYGYSTMAYLLNLKVDFIDADIVDDHEIKSCCTYSLNEDECVNRLKLIVDDNKLESEMRNKVNGN